MTERDDPVTSAEEAPAPHDPRRLQEVAQLQAIIARGFDVEAFMRTDIGLFIRSRASREIEEAQDALLECNPHDYQRITALQLQARVAGRVLTYFADMVKEAEVAEEQHAQVFAAASGE